MCVEQYVDSVTLVTRCQPQNQHAVSYGETVAHEICFPSLETKMSLWLPTKNGTIEERETWQNILSLRIIQEEEM